jgi:GDPmannose 4,6-dehydratase
MKKTALITGITGQDGSYLAEHLLNLGYEVHGLIRRVAIEQPRQRLSRLLHLTDRLHLHTANIESYPGIFHVLSRNRFDECYHLAAQSFAGESFNDGFSTMFTNSTGTHHMLSALYELQPKCRFYFAGSSEMFGKPGNSPQSETTRFHPRSAYGISKVTGHQLTVNYRECHGMFACTGILFNHESPRRGYEFVTRKITQAAARIKFGLQRELQLGTLDARRDWGHAADYVGAIHAMLQLPEPDDFVIATGKTHSVEEFCQLAFAEAGLDHRNHVKGDPALRRPAENDLLVGDASKARSLLGWAPTRSFGDLVKEMVESDIASVAFGEPPFPAQFRTAEA